MRRSIPGLVALVVTLLGRGTARAWGPEGHRIVARLAESRLTVEARAGVRALLGHEHLADVATWADDIRSSRPETADWHFVDIPITRDDYEPARDCAPTRRGDCAIAAIGRERRALADGRASRARRTEALAFLVHLVADLHQPLHAANDGDGGGNAEMVRFGTRSMTLHAVWDGGIIARTRLDETAYVARLEALLATRDTTAMARGSVTDWALAAHAAARTAAYREPDGRRVVSGSRLTQAYYTAARPVVDEQLASAGVRLAHLLNAAFAAAARSGKPPQGPGDG